MAFDRAKTALATLEEKLRRQLGLAGIIGATFEPKLSPVLITTDLREPGNSFYRGRHFAFATQFVVAAGSEYAALRFEVDTVILGGTFAPAGIGTLYATAPNVAAAVVCNTNAGVWTDRKLQTTDLVPITHGGNGALTGTNFSLTNTIAKVPAGGTLPIPQMFIAAGGSLSWHVAPAASYCISIAARIAEQQ